LEIVKNALFTNVYEVDCFQKEFQDLTKEKLTIKPPFPRYQKWLIGSLAILEEQGMEAIKLKNFEQLENTKPKLYSIRYSHSKLNSRVIYVFTDEGEILLLVSFKEKRKSDYNRNIELAHKRLKLLET